MVLQYDVQDHIATITLDRPEVKNALNRELFWISDFQSVGFAREGKPQRFDAPAGPWDRARVYLVPLDPRSRVNAALTDAALAPSESGPALSVAATSYGAPAGDLAVDVHDATAHDELGRGFVNLPAQGEGTTGSGQQWPHA